MPCYYCDEAFQDHDIAVVLPLVEMRRQDDGGVLAQDHETRYVHQSCLGDPDG